MNNWLLGFSIGIAALSAAAWWWQKYPATKRGMKQFAQSPRALRRMNTVFAERDQLLRQAERMTDAQVDRMVQSLFDANTDGRNTSSQVLQKVGTRAEPALLRALDDPRCDRDAKRSEDWREKPVFETITSILAAIGSEPLVPRISDLITSGTEEQRKLAALCIAEVGNDAAINPTLAALRDPEEYVRSYAMMGIQRGVKAGRASPQFRLAMFDALQRFVTGEAGFDTFHDKKAAETLLDLDRQRALPLLTSDRCIRLENSHLSEILKHLNEVSATIESARIMPILEHAKTTEKYPWQYIRHESLRMLVRVDPALASTEINLALSSPDKDVRSRAAEALREKEGLGDAGLIPFSLDLRSLDTPVSHVLAAWRFQAEVNNGGVSQFFFNSAGDDWPLTLEAFDALGAKACAGILRSAVEFFGEKGPSTDRTKRIRQYAAVSDEREKTLDELSSKFYRDEDGLDVLVTRYMIQNANVFKAAIRSHVKPQDSTP